VSRQIGDRLLIEEPADRGDAKPDVVAALGDGGEDVLVVEPAHRRDADLVLIVGAGHPGQQRRIDAVLDGGVPDLES
jgi:hypothetical protein